MHKTSLQIIHFFRIFLKVENRHQSTTNDQYFFGATWSFSWFRRVFQRIHSPIIMNLKVESWPRSIQRSLFIEDRCRTTSRSWFSSGPRWWSRSSLSDSPEFLHEFFIGEIRCHSWNHLIQNYIWINPNHCSYHFSKEPCIPLITRS